MAANTGPVVAGDLFTGQSDAIYEIDVKPA
jgi:hypothetical protein